MIVISAGLRKAGTGLFFNLTNDLLIAAGKEDVRDIKEKFNLEDILKYHNCNVEKLTWRKFIKILPIHFKGKTFVIKTHDRPTKLIRFLMALKIIKVTYIYRDPRDVLLSALDHGKKIRNKGETHTFAYCSSIEITIPKVKSWLDKITMKWIRLKKVSLFKYEDLISNPISQLKRLADFLELDDKKIDFERILARYDRNNLDSTMKGHLHFNVGNAGRFKTALEEKDLNLCNQQFSRYLEKMGYDI